MTPKSRYRKLPFFHLGKIFDLVNVDFDFLSHFSPKDATIIKGWEISKVYKVSNGERKVHKNYN